MLGKVQLLHCKGMTSNGLPYIWVNVVDTLGAYNLMELFGD